MESAMDGPIPRIVHFIWLQGEDHMRSHACEYWENVRRTRHIMGETWRVILWDELSLIPVMTAIDPAVWARYRSLDQFAMKADLARFCLLKIYGGIYLDADFIVHRHLGPLIHLADEAFVAMRRCQLGSFVHSLLNGTLSSRPESLQTYILISPPGCRLWTLMIEHILTFRRQHAFEPNGLYYTRFTCLNALGRAVDRYRREEPNGPPVLFITHLTEHYGKHVGKGDWAGFLTTYGAFRHRLIHEMSWFLILSFLLNVGLTISLIILLLLGRTINS
jgi:hypothetical protein